MSEFTISRRVPNTWNDFEEVFSAESGMDLFNEVWRRGYKVQDLFLTINHPDFRRMVKLHWIDGIIYVQHHEAGAGYYYSPEEANAFFHRIMALA